MNRGPFLRSPYKILLMYPGDRASCQIVWNEIVVALAAVSATTAPLLKGQFGVHWFVKFHEPDMGPHSHTLLHRVGSLTVGVPPRLYPP